MKALEEYKREDKKRNQPTKHELVTRLDRMSALTEELIDLMSKDAPAPVVLDLGPSFGKLNLPQAHDKIVLEPLREPLFAAAKDDSVGHRTSVARS